MEDAQTVIQEIANQLGMAVDQAGSFITTYLPSYAGLKSMQAAIIIIVMVVILLLLIGTAILSWNMPKLMRRSRRKETDRETARLSVQVEEKEKDLALIERLRDEGMFAGDGDVGAQSKKLISDLCDGIDQYHSHMNKMNRRIDDVDEDIEVICYVISIVAGVISVIFLIITLITIGCQASEIAGWQAFPEARLIEMALHAIH